MAVIRVARPRLPRLPRRRLQDRRWCQPLAAWRLGRSLTSSFFLHQLELAHLGPIVKNEGVDGAMLLHLVKAGQLCELGFSKFQAPKIIDRLPTAHGVQDPGSSAR